jgi:hypothetical protein
MSLAGAEHSAREIIVITEERERGIPKYYGTGGVGVAGPYLLYFCSMYARIPLRLFPSSIIFITSRVMPMQIPQARLIRSNCSLPGDELSFT